MLQNISDWAATIHLHLNTDNKQRRGFFISLIGKQVKLKPGILKRLGGIRRGEFVIQARDGEGNNQVVQMDEIMGEHVALESVAVAVPTWSSIHAM
ncbi:hypothetical protein T440DRAFT_79901 [Plenodomus tracheiphilus IPT5]|uniref:Uncharacterized protein n=1 Tax=Plenodomus tracheiphilus IPT5 TaxID=1408161 RepID=A0A6A7B534_9PLEO|nr:hypothetical protein T440DRAFT_79901 [Plenodomus tracheiphilus IPT5]